MRHRHTLPSTRALVKTETCGQFQGHALSFDLTVKVLYTLCMTDLVSFRAKRPKRELQRAFGNVSRKLNELIERELSNSGEADWRDVLTRERPAVSDEDYEKCLRPE